MVDLKNMDKYFLYFLSCTAIFYVFMTQLQFLNSSVSSWDQVDFVLAMDRYDLRAMQPHFPGYPYFILGGLMTRLFVDEPQQALVLFNVLIYASSLIPLFLIAARLLPKANALVAATVVYTSSYTLIIVNQPMSEGAAMAVFWWFVWSTAAADDKNTIWWNALPLFLFSILLGIRLSYIPMGIALVYLFFRKWKRKSVSFTSLLSYLMIAVAFQFIWVGAVVLTEGSISSFLNLAFGFTGGHFQEWGGTAASNELSLFPRIQQFLLINVFWWGIFFGNPLLMIVYLFIFLFIFLPKKHSLQRNPAVVWLMIMLMSGYGFWALFAQNIEKPRHALPVALMVIFLGVTIFLRRQNGRVGVVLSALLISSQAFASAGSIHEQAEEVPAVYQLAHFLEEQNDPFILYTWEETRIMEYLKSPFPHKRVFSYNVFQYDQRLYEGRTIFVTDRVVKGFENQGIDVEGKIERVKRFHSNEKFDPVYHDIVLYKWKP